MKKSQSHHGGQELMDGRPISQQMRASSVQRALKELEKAAERSREREKASSLITRLETAAKSPLETTYVQDPSTARWGPDVVATTELTAWPPQILESMKRASKQVPMGLFDEIRHAWAVQDSTTLVMWDYQKKDAVVVCPVVSSPIVSAALVLPLPGTLFSDQVKYLLVLLTECDVRLFALVADKTSERPWKVLDTQMTAPLDDSQLSTSLVTTPSRRILLGGVDGALYEYVYSPHLPKDPTAKKFRQVQPALSSPWASYLPGVVRDLLFSSSQPSSLISLVVDAPRQLVYGVHESNHLSLFHVRRDISHVATVSLSDLAKSFGGSLSSVVAVSPLPKTSSSAHSIALTSTGQRLYLALITSSEGPQSIRAMSLRALPSALSASSFVALVARHDVCLLAQANQQLVALANDASQPPLRFVETLSTLPLFGSLQALVAVQPPSPPPQLNPASNGIKRSIDGATKANALDFLQRLGHFGAQFNTPAQEFRSISTGGMQTWTQRRPIDHLDARLRSQQSLQPLIDWYGSTGVAAMLFGLPHNPAAAHALCELDMESTTNGLALFIAHVVAPVWNVAVRAPAHDQVSATYHKLKAVKQLLEHVTPYAVALHTDIPHLQQQHAPLRDFHALLGSCVDALFGWTQLTKKDATTPVPCFYEVVGTDDGAKQFRAMLIDLAKASPAIVGVLLANCESFFTVWEAAPFQGLQTVSSAKAAATLSSRDKLLEESLAQFRIATGVWPATKPTIQLVRHVVKEYIAASYYYGAVALTAAAAALFPLAEKDACFAPLLEIAATPDAQRAVVRFVMEGTDGVFQLAVLKWLPDKSALQDCPWTPTIKSYLHKHDAEWYVRLCIHHRDFDDAADVLWTRAHEIPSSLTIGERAALVARALACVQASAAQPQHVQDIQDALDVFQMQTRIYDALRHEKLPQDKLNQLRSSILNMSTLFNEFAMPFGLYTECLRILHACRTNEPQLIATLWKQLIFGFVPSASQEPAASWLREQHNQAGLVVPTETTFEDGAWVTPLKTYVLQMGTSLLHAGADFVFPLEMLVSTLETVDYYYLQVASRLEEHSWVAKIFLDLQFPPALLVGIYLQLKDSTRNVQELHWLRGMHTVVAAAPDRRPFEALVREQIDALEAHADGYDQCVRWRDLLKGL
ncbi:unnamed protein product [Aphanomyces euteiches]